MIIKLFLRRNSAIVDGRNESLQSFESLNRLTVSKRSKRDTLATTAGQTVQMQ